MADKQLIKKITDTISAISSITAATTQELSENNERALNYIIDSISGGMYEQLNDIEIEMKWSKENYKELESTPEINLLLPSLLIKNFDIVKKLKSDDIDIKIAVDRWRRYEYLGVKNDRQRRAGWKHDTNVASVAQRPNKFNIPSASFSFDFHQEKYFKDDFPSMKGERGNYYIDEGNTKIYQGQRFALRIVAIDKATQKQIYTTDHLYKFWMFGLHNIGQGGAKTISYKPI